MTREERRSFEAMFDDAQDSSIRFDINPEAAAEIYRSSMPGTSVRMHNFLAILKLFYQIRK